MIRLPGYLRVVRISAWYDLIVTAGFATPWTFTLVLAGLQDLGRILGMAWTVPAFAPEHMLMANLLGSLVLVWAVLRLRDPQLRFGRYDAAARFLFVTWQAVALVHGAHPLVWGFLVMDLAFGLAESVPVAGTRELAAVSLSSRPPAQ